MAPLLFSHSLPGVDNLQGGQDMGQGELLAAIRLQRQDDLSEGRSAWLSRLAVHW